MPVLHPKSSNVSASAPIRATWVHTQVDLHRPPPLDTTTLAIVINSRGHTTKCGLRVPNPNSRGHATKRGFRDCPGFLNSNGRLGPKRGWKCYVTPTFSGVPNKGDKIRSQTYARGHNDAPSVVP